MSRLSQLDPVVQVNELMDEVLIFTDRNGTVLSKNSTGVSSSLCMEYTGKDLQIQMQVFVHAMGNGACAARVKYHGKVVFDAGGSYITGAFNVQAKTYIPGDWEQEIK